MAADSDLAVAVVSEAVIAGKDFLALVVVDVGQVIELGLAPKSCSGTAKKRTKMESTTEQTKLPQNTSCSQQQSDSGESFKENS